MHAGFPIFKRLELSDKGIILNYTRNFEAYSDYNFLSLYTWNIEDKIEFSILNRNLIVRFTDYSNRKLFYSFIGKNKIKETTIQVIEYAKENNINQTLKLIPEECIIDIKNFKKISIEEDKDNFDYIFNISSLKTYKGRNLRAKKNFVNRFLKKYNSRVEILDINDIKVKNSILELFCLWKNEKNFTKEQVLNEYLALKKLLLNSDNFTVLVLGVFVNNKLIGFSISEILENGYAILHFLKADFKNFVGIYPYIIRETAKILDKNGTKFINFVQDVGVEGLRNMKKSYRPCKLLKKYKIKLDY